ncbi:hypothetical protein FOPE_02151 [Fonsecaea pedrosoi]|nr:hypothetical protein FOPE_02151 [Fonsecaea pedrosoi]
MRSEDTIGFSSLSGTRVEEREMRSYKNKRRRRYPMPEPRHSRRADKKDEDNDEDMVSQLLLPDGGDIGGSSLPLRPRPCLPGPPKHRTFQTGKNDGALRDGTRSTWTVIARRPGLLSLSLMSNGTAPPPPPPPQKQGYSYNGALEGLLDGRKLLGKYTK